MLFYATFRLYNLLVLFKKKQYANNGRLIALRLQNQPYPERNVWWWGGRKYENRRQMPFLISIYLLTDYSYITISFYNCAMLPYLFLLDVFFPFLSVLVPSQDNLNAVCIKRVFDVLHSNRRSYLHYK